MDALPNANGRKKSIPALNVDASEIPTSTLWRALESQRQQCEEDEKWLEEEAEEPTITVSLYHKFDFVINLIFISKLN